MDRTQKEELVASFNDAFSEATLVVVTSQSGLTVAQSTELRQEMRQAGASFKVTKNRLTRLALEGTTFAYLSDLFKGPTAIAYSDDPVAAARIAVKFAEGNDKFQILGGGLSEQALDVSGVTALAKLPSLDEPRKARWHDPDTGHPYRRRDASTCGTTRARARCTCRAGRGRLSR